MGITGNGRWLIVELDSLPIIRDSLLPFLYCFLESIQGFSCIGIKLEFLYKLAELQYEVIFLQTPLENHTLVSPCYIQVPTLISYTPPALPTSPADTKG